MYVCAFVCVCLCMCVCVCVCVHEQVFFSLLSTSHVVKEEDGSTFLRIVT